MKIAFLSYPGFTALDVVGTYQVLAATPGMQLAFVARTVGTGSSYLAAARVGSATS